MGATGSWNRYKHLKTVLVMLVIHWECKSCKCCGLLNPRPRQVQEFLVFFFFKAAFSDHVDSSLTQYRASFMRPRALQNLPLILNLPEGAADECFVRTASYSDLGYLGDA